MLAYFAKYIAAQSRDFGQLDGGGAGPQAVRAAEAPQELDPQWQGGGTMVRVKQRTDAVAPELGRALAPGETAFLEHHPPPGWDQEDD